MKQKIDFIVCCTKYIEKERICRLVQLWAEENCVHIRLREESPVNLFSDGVADNCLLLIDGDSLGPDAAERLACLREAQPESGIVLFSSDPRFAIVAYRCHPNGFVEKPMSYRRLSVALARCFRVWQAGLMRLDVPINHRRMHIPLCWVYYAEAAGRNTILHHSGGALCVNCSLRGLETALPSPPFVRCQKSFVVHLGAVCGFAGGSLVMRNGSTISAARPRIREIQAQLRAYQKIRREEE